MPTIDGKNNQSYVGVRATTPPQMIVNKQRAPTQNDYQEYVIGTQWLYRNPATPLNSAQYVLVDKAQGVATWIALNTQGGDGIQTLTGDTGGAVGPDANANINVIGGAGIDIVGTPGTHQLVVSATGGGGGFTAINTIVLDTPGAGVYVPTAGMAYCTVECVGGGAGSYGSNGTGAPPYQANSGGGGGGYCKRTFNAAAIGVSQNYFIGDGGAAGTPVGATPGQDTTFGTIVIMTAGGGSLSITSQFGGVGGVSVGGDLNVSGQQGGAAFQGIDDSGITFPASSGFGGSSVLGFGGGGADSTASPAAAGSLYGGGAGGSYAAQAISNGYDGAKGVIIITEYIS
jgi:hypothetical protein